jgi:hypothetical protein
VLFFCGETDHGPSTENPVFLTYIQPAAIPASQSCSELFYLHISMSHFAEASSVASPLSHRTLPPRGSYCNRRMAKQVGDMIFATLTQNHHCLKRFHRRVELLNSFTQTFRFEKSELS